MTSDRAFTAVVCDLFETVVTFDPARLPVMTLGGRSRPSTTPLLLPVLLHHGVDVDPAALAAALLATWARARGRADAAEVSSVTRMAEALAEMRIDAGPELPRALADAHADAVCGCAVLPDAHRDALDTLATTHRLALVSNFDHAPAVRRMLSRLGLDRRFEAVVISDELGWRKPDPRPFRAALHALGIAPGDALFIGDSPVDDVAGAAACGMAVAWVDPSGATLPEGIPQPGLRIPSLAHLPAALRAGRRAGGEPPWGAP